MLRSSDIDYQNLTLHASEDSEDRRILPGIMKINTEGVHAFNEGNGLSNGSSLGTAKIHTVIMTLDRRRMQMA